MNSLSLLLILLLGLSQSWAFASLPPSTSRANSCLNMNTQTNNHLESAKSRIAQAISIGAPAYNAGDIEECTRVYQETAAGIVDLLPKTLQEELSKVLSTADQQTSMDAAWAFRRQFDAILDYKEPFIPTQQANDVTLEPFSNRMIPEQPLPINDNVMGGISRGGWDANEKKFIGNTSLANNGGFASIRWRMPNIQNWSYAKGIYLKVKHSQPDKHTFRLLLKDTLCERVRGANYKTVFANPENSDGVILVPFTAFDQMEQMGRSLQAPPLNRGEVREIGIMAIKPSVVGEFELKLEEWGLYS